MMEALAAYSWFGQVSVLISVLAVCWSMVWQNLEHFRLQQFFARHFNRRARRLAAVVDPYLSLTFEEYEGGRIKSSDAFNEVKSFLTTASTRDVRHLRAECGGGQSDANGTDRDRLVLSMAKGEEVADAFRGATVWWSAGSVPPPRDAVPWTRAARAERRHFRLEFHEADRDLVLGEYMAHVRRRGRAIMVQNRQRRLYTNLHYEGYDDGWYEDVWTHVPFRHPKTFDKLAMDPAKKKEVMDDLDMFRDGRDYHDRVGKPWKRGYLLYGPPGTGKSTMVAAMANYLDYDVYDLELTSVKTNTELRKLLIETKSKSIMVFEDIDCTLDVTGKRKSNKQEEEEEQQQADLEEKADPRCQGKKHARSQVTLSGLLNLIDGLWSACGEERLVVFTTNHVDKLDPALIRTGRMDKKIEMSYYDFESFRFLARMHLDDDDDDVEAHELFGVVRDLLQEVNMAPVDVGEHLTPKTRHDDAGSCLARLVAALQKAKAEAEDATKAAAQAQQAQQDGN